MESRWIWWNKTSDPRLPFHAVVGAPVSEEYTYKWVTPGKGNVHSQKLIEAIPKICLEYDMLTSSNLKLACVTRIMWPLHFVSMESWDLITRFSLRPAEASRRQRSMLLSWKQINRCQSWSRLGAFVSFTSPGYVFTMPHVLPKNMSLALGTQWSWPTCCCDCLNFHVDGVHFLHDY